MKRTVSQIDGKTKKSQQSIQYNILEEEEKKKKHTKVKVVNKAKTHPLADIE